MTNDELIKFFDGREWYDNSKIKMLRGCKRKAYFQLVGPRGTPLGGKVGDGANFGSSMHAGLARYYNGWVQNRFLARKNKNSQSQIQTRIPRMTHIIDCSERRQVA